MLVVCAAAGCKQLDGRAKNRDGNKDYHEARFVDAIAKYEQALKTVDDPTIHYNLGLAYSKVFKPGFDGPVLLAPTSDSVCKDIPDVKVVQAGACVKEGDRHYQECSAAKSAKLNDQISAIDAELKALPPIDEKKPDDQKTEADRTAEAHHKEVADKLRDATDDLQRITCPSSFTCIEGDYCSIVAPEIADRAAQHFQIWIAVQPPDDEIAAQLKVAEKERDEAKEKFDLYDGYMKHIADLDAAIETNTGLADKAKEANDAAKEAEYRRMVDESNKAETEAKKNPPPTFDKSRLEPLEQRVDDLLTKKQTRNIMSQLWLESSQYEKALSYWEGLLKARPNDTGIMGAIAGINQKAGDWRKSIEWYNKSAELLTEPSSKELALESIANTAWSKLNSKTLSPADSVELADRGLEALQRAMAIEPKLAKLYGLSAALYNFRSQNQNASFAAAIDRSSAQDLQNARTVLNEQAKRAAGAPIPPTPPPAPPAPGGSSGTSASGGTPKTGG
ncbi:MAG TPA: hypothetical protein VGM88_10150 [Kofleriaceae bacterium]